MNVHLGFEVGTGEAVSIPLRHLVVTGITQYGKTTALEALVTRADMTAIVFVTKPGENILPGAPRLKPYLRSQSDWRYVEEVISASLQERPSRLLRSKIMDVTRGTRGLDQVWKRVRAKLRQEKLRAFDRDLYRELDNYLEIVVPQIDRADLAANLEILWGQVQVIDLQGFTQEMQNLVMRSVMEEVHRAREWHDIIVVVPEAHAFVPQGRNTPVKSAARMLIRQGLTLRKLVLFDSQDIASCDKGVLKQCDVWLLGRQREYNEAMHTIAQIPLPRSARPRPEDVMTLKLGHFYVSAEDQVRHVYVQPAWLDEEEARRVATGEMQVPSPPETEPEEDPMVIAELEEEVKQGKARVVKLEGEVADLKGLVTTLHDGVNEAETGAEAYRQARDKAQAEADRLRSTWNALQEAVSKAFAILGFPANRGEPVRAEVDLDQVVEHVLARIGPQRQVVQVTPPEALKHRFQEEALARLKAEVDALDPRERRIVAWLEQHGNTASAPELALHVEGRQLPNRGRYRIEFYSMLKRLTAAGLVIGVERQGYAPALATRVTDRLAPYDPTPEQSGQVYQHLLHLLATEGRGGTGDA